MQIVPIFGGSAPPLHCCRYRKLEVLQGIKIEENFNKLRKTSGTIWLINALLLTWIHGFKQNAKLCLWSTF